MLCFTGSFTTVEFLIVYYVPLSCGRRLLWYVRTRCTFRIFGGVASRVPWGWRDSYGKTGNFGRVGDKSMFKMYKKAGVGREGDIG